MDKDCLPQLGHPKWVYTQEVKDAATGKWLFLVADVMSWIDKCRVLVRSIKKEMITRLADDAVDIADGLAKAHIETSHFVTDRHYNKNTAKKVLVQWSKAEYYSANTRDLFNRVAHIAEIHRKLELEIPLEDLIDEQLDSCKSVLAKAQQLVFLRAAVVCLEGTSGKREEEAQALIEKDRGLPKSIVSALQAVVECSKKKR